MEAENAPGERRVAPNPWATLSVHVVASPASHGALEGGGLSVRSFVVVNFLLRVLGRYVTAEWSPQPRLATTRRLGRRGPRVAPVPSIW